ncbi:MAG: DNRLRE domain-containing protein [Caldilineaceae bacterium]|nr:DNRLRE domain-containing protein [Caldilineaceae bacterium]
MDLGAAIYADDWGGYAVERAEIAQFIQDNGINNLVMLAGDAHMVAGDDGRNNRYVSDGAPLFPVFHAAPLHRGGSIKGGPYELGSFVNPTVDDGQFGVVTVEDAGWDEICVEFSGQRNPAEGGPLIELLLWRRCFEAKPQQSYRHARSFQNGVMPDSTYGQMQAAVIGEQTAGVARKGAALCTVDGDDPPGTGRDVVTLLSWPLAGLPTGATVVAVRLSFHIQNPSDHSYGLFAMKRAWQQGAASWLSADGLHTWEKAGAEGDADRDRTTLGELRADTVGWQELWLNHQGIAQVQAWVDDAESNFGFALANATVSDGIAFDCLTPLTPENQPKLTIEYIRTGATNSTLYLPLLMK